jgi:glycosyltransferase involved in cell wall biosynthesis
MFSSVDHTPYAPHGAHHCEIVLVSSGHLALDHRVFYKEAVSLRQSFAHVRVVGDHPADEVRDGVTITALPGYRSRLARFLWRPWQCYLAVGSPRQVRVLILHDAELLPLAPLVKLFTGWRIIYDAHEDFAQLIMRREWIPAPLRRGLGRAVGTVEKTLAGMCDGVIGVTEVLTGYFDHPRRLAVYNLPGRAFITEAAERSRPIAEREYDLVHLGTLSDERLEFLCAVLDGVFRRKPAARALLIGVRPDQEQRLSKRFSDQRVTVLGQVGYHRIAGHLGNCRIGLNVHPVLYPHLRCAIPVKALEYMAAGCNLITSFLPELARLLDRDGQEHIRTVYVPDPERFAEEAVLLLDESSVMTEHQQALMQIVATRLHWEHEAEKLVKFLSTIVPGKEGVLGEQVLDH